MVGAGLSAALGRGRLRFHAIGVGALASGAVAAFIGIDVLLDLGFGQHPGLRVLGFNVLPKPPPDATFELTVRDLGHALFPWSAFVPFAFGRLLRRRRGLAPDPAARDTALRVSLLVGAATAYGAAALVAPFAGDIPFSAPALLAAVAALVLTDFDQGAGRSRVVAIGTPLLAVLLWQDMVDLPVKALSPFGVAERTLPQGVEGIGAEQLMAATAIFVVAAWLSFVDDERRAPRLGSGRWLRQRLAAYRAGARSLARAYKGNLLFGALVVEAALCGLGAMLYVGRRLGWSAVTRFPHNLSLVGVNAWWVLPLAPLLVVLTVELGRAGFALLLRALRLRRAGATAAAGLLAGSLLCFGFYPALAAQLSPKEVFERYAELKGSGQPLGVLGLQARAAEFYAQGEHVEPLRSSRAAHRWLMQAPPDGPVPRRWLVFRSQELAELNSLYRSDTRRNLPVVDARSGAILLGSNELGALENRNWLERHVKSEAGPIQHPVSAMFEDQLEALGWSVLDEQGVPVEPVVPQRAYTMRFFYRVHRRVDRRYEAFLHIDGHRKRHNGDHEPLFGDYEMPRWLPGDVIIDEVRLQLEPNFTPGKYTVYYGFFQGKKRFEVTKGRHHDNRVDGGVLLVR